MKPVDLIVANVMHEVADELRRVQAIVDDLTKKAGMIQSVQPPFDQIYRDVARSLLCNISHDADLSVVFSALAACKAPATAEMISEGLQAVQDMRVSC